MASTTTLAVGDGTDVPERTAGGSALPPAPPVEVRLRPSRRRHATGQGVCRLARRRPAGTPDVAARLGGRHRQDQPVRVRLESLVAHQVLSARPLSRASRSAAVADVLARAESGGSREHQVAVPVHDERLRHPGDGQAGLAVLVGAGASGTGRRVRSRVELAQLSRALHDSRRDARVSAGEPQQHRDIDRPATDVGRPRIRARALPALGRYEPRRGAERPRPLVRHGLHTRPAADPVRQRFVRRPGRTRDVHDLLERPVELQLREAKGQLRQLAHRAARYTLAFLRTANLVGASRTATVARLLDWAQDNLVHFYGDLDYGTAEQHWQYRGLPPITRIIEGTTSTRPGGAIFAHWTAGCHGTAGFLRNVLRVVNIPVELIRVCGHAQTHFLPEGTYLDHTDGLYDSTFAATGRPASRPPDRRGHLRRLVRDDPGQPRHTSCVRQHRSKGGRAHAIVRRPTACLRSGGRVVSHEHVPATCS